MFSATRRRFLGDIGYSMLAASLGSTLAREFGAEVHPSLGVPRVPSDLEGLIATMLEFAPADMLPRLASEIALGTKLEKLILAGALANARTLGGNDYEGYHAFMALLPALAMSRRMPAGQEALPVLKVLWRNTARIRKVSGGARKELPAVEPTRPGIDSGKALHLLVRDCELEGAERRLARDCGEGVAGVHEELDGIVQDDLNVHRIVLAWRVWDVMPVAGEAHAYALLRQIVRFCIDEEKDRKKRGNPEPEVRTDVPRILEQHGLLSLEPGERVPDDAWIDALAKLVFAAERARAADAVAAALAEGFAPDAVAEAIALAGNQLLRHDTGRNRVHGASVGVHASDAANAWRNVARVGPAATRLSNLVVAAYHTAGQSKQVGVEPWPFADELGRLETKDPGELLRAAATAIEQKDQRAACAAMQRYGDLGHPAEPAFALLLRYAVSEDGALHAEKYFHTAHEEFGRTRAAFRWRHVVALARVTASESGEPAPGVADARKLLGV